MTARKPDRTSSTAKASASKSGARAGASKSGGKRTAPKRTKSAWADPSSEIGSAVDRYSKETLAAYREAPRFVEEHANLERAAVEGGYGRRQLFELIQNGADELLGQQGRVQVVFTAEALYCSANEAHAAERGCRLRRHLQQEEEGRRSGALGLVRASRRRHRPETSNHFDCFLVLHSLHLASGHPGVFGVDDGRRAAS